MQPKNHRGIRQDFLLQILAGIALPTQYQGKHRAAMEKIICSIYQLCTLFHFFIRIVLPT